MSVVASEALALGGLVVLGWMVGRGRRSGGALVSMALTSTPHRRRTRKANRSIPTILAGRIDVGIVDVSAVDTECRAWSTPRGLGGGTGSPHPGAGRAFPCPALPAPTQGPGGHGSTLVPADSRPESTYFTRVGRYWPGIGRTARRPRVTHLTRVSDVMASETLRSHETTQGVKGTNARTKV